MSSTELLRREWTAFRTPGRLISLAVAALSVLALGLLFAGGTSSGVSDSPLHASAIASEAGPQ